MTLSVLSLTLILASCGPASRAALNEARQHGRVEARVDLPDVPPGCLRATPHAAVRVGDSIAGVLKREQAQLDKANREKLACGQFSLDQQQLFR